MSSIVRPSVNHNSAVRFSLYSDFEDAMRRWVHFDAVEALVNHENVMNTITKAIEQDASVRTTNRKDVFLLIY